MSRKDFIHIASIIRDLGPDDGVHGECGRERIARAFADGLKSTNGQFKPELFVQAATGKVPLTARRAR